MNSYILRQIICASNSNDGESYSSKDAIIKCSDGTIYVHKFILLEMFGYFRSMYDLFDDRHKYTKYVEFKILPFHKHNMQYLLDIIYDGQLPTTETIKPKIILYIIKLYDMLIPLTNYMDHHIKKLLNILLKYIRESDNYDKYELVDFIDNCDNNYFDEVLSVIVSKYIKEFEIELFKLVSYDCDCDENNGDSEIDNDNISKLYGISYVTRRKIIGIIKKSKENDSLLDFCMKNDYKIYLEDMNGTNGKNMTFPYYLGSCSPDGYLTHNTILPMKFRVYKTPDNKLATTILSDDHTNEDTLDKLIDTYNEKKM